MYFVDWEDSEEQHTLFTLFKDDVPVKTWIVVSPEEKQKYIKVLKVRGVVDQLELVEQLAEILGGDKVFASGRLYDWLKNANRDEKIQVVNGQGIIDFYNIKYEEGLFV